MDPTAREELLEIVRLQRAGFEALGCPFYEALTEGIGADVASDGVVGALLAPHAAAPFEQVYILRFLGAVHRRVLDGQEPALAARYPSTGGDGDVSATFDGIQDLVAARPEVLGDWAARPPQTNEVGRAAALMSGLLVVADALRLPLRLREIGSSAALNLRLDRFWYEQDGVGFGDPDSAVRFVDLWHGGAPPFASGVEIADRRGCDRDPVDAGTHDGALTLLSYLWPEPPERFHRARAAIDLAETMPVTVDQADAREWVPSQLADRPAGAATVVMHSIMWQYLDDATRDTIRSSLAEAGRSATPDTPVAWVRLEPHAEDFSPAEVRATWWDGSSPEPHDELLATTGFHGGDLEWVLGVS